MILYYIILYYITTHYISVLLHFVPRVHMLSPEGVRPNRSQAL